MTLLEVAAERGVTYHAARKLLHPETVEADQWARRRACSCGSVTSSAARLRCLECVEHDKWARWGLMAERWSDGATLTEIADELGVTVGTVSAQMHRARAAGVALPHRPPGGLRPREQRWQTHCKWGHTLDDDSVYVTPSGYRQCRVCLRRRSREAKARQRRVDA